MGNKDNTVMVHTKLQKRRQTAPDTVIRTVALPSGSTARAAETASGALGLAVGSGCIFLSEEDIYPFTRLLKSAERRFLKR